MSNQELSSSHLYLKTKTKTKNKTWQQANHISNQSCHPFQHYPILNKNTDRSYKKK
jgi:hypothetical protein